MTDTEMAVVLLVTSLIVPVLYLVKAWQMKQEYQGIAARARLVEALRTEDKTVWWETTTTITTPITTHHKESK